MSDNRFYDRYRIPSARAGWHDYNGGAYFVTICTQFRQHYFGEIADGEMRLSELGKYAEQCIGCMKQHNRYADVPLFVVMTNHIHMVVFFHADVVQGGFCDVVETVQNNNVETVQNNNVETVHAPSLRGADYIYNKAINGKQNKRNVLTNRWKNEFVNQQMQYISRQKNKLSFSIGNFKSAVTRYANKNKIPFAWQTRFHDHIIRNETEMKYIAQYIKNNVLQWVDE